MAINTNAKYELQTKSIGTRHKTRSCHFATSLK